MVETKMPFGSISEKCVKSIAAFNDEFILNDDCGNVWEITESTFENLKKQGYPINDFRRRK